MTSRWTNKLSKFAKVVAENLPKVGEAGAAALVGIPVKRSSSVSFKDFIHRISLCENQDEIERTIGAELSRLELVLAQPSVECTVRARALSVAIYCHLLGHDVRFICIHAITLAQQGSLLQKRTGYLAVSLLLRPTDELAVLLINTLLGDLRSRDVLVICTALNMVCHLVTPDNTGTFLPPVLEKLKHRQAVVRDKATRALHSVLLQSPELLTSQLEAVEAAVLDRDPIVMASAVQLCLTFAALNPALLTHLTTSLMTILGQIQSRKLPPDFEHKGVPAPWLQCSLIRLISFLCPDDSGLADTFAQFLLCQLRAAVPSTAMGFAVLCECVSAAATLPPDRRTPEPAPGGGDAPAAVSLHTAALRCVRLMVRSSAANVRYAGVAALCRLCEGGAVRPPPPLQLAVLQCLHDGDETLRLRALQLLHTVADTESAPAVCERLLEAAVAAGRPEVRTMLLSDAAQLAERHLAARPTLFSVLDRVVELTGDDSPYRRLQLRLVAEEDGPLRPAAARLYADLLIDGDSDDDRRRAHALWTVGELAAQLEPETLERTLAAVCESLPRLAAEDPDPAPAPADRAEAAPALESHLRCIERAVWACGPRLSAAAADRLSVVLTPLRHHWDPAAGELADCALTLLADLERLRRVADTADALLGGRLRPDFTLSFTDALVAAALDAGADVLRPPAAPAAGSAHSGASQPSRRASSTPRGGSGAADTPRGGSPPPEVGSPFETLGPLALPDFLQAGAVRVEPDEPPAVWTLLGRAADPASGDHAPTEPHAQLPSDDAQSPSDDEQTREAAILFPRGAAS